MEKRPNEVQENAETSVLQGQTGSSGLLQRNHQKEAVEDRHHYANEQLVLGQVQQGLQTSRGDAQDFWVRGGCSVRARKQERESQQGQGVVY